MPPCYTPTPAKRELEWSFSYSSKRFKALHSGRGRGEEGEETRRACKSVWEIKVSCSRRLCVLPKQPLASASEVHWKDQECESISPKCSWWKTGGFCINREGDRPTLPYDMPLVWCSIITFKGHTATHTSTHTFIFYLCLNFQWNNPLPSSYPNYNILKPFLKPQPFEFIGISQNGPILKECPHFVTRLSNL